MEKVELTPEEHNARAILMGLVYDKLTHMYRPLTPAGHKYKYTGCYHADDVTPVGKGVARNIEISKGRQNIVSGNRTPGAVCKPYEPPWMARARERRNGKA